MTPPNTASPQPPANTDDWRLPVAGRLQVRRQLQAMLRADALTLTVVIALIGTAAVSAILGPWLVGQIVNRVRTGGGTGSVDVLATLVVVSAVANLLLTRFARLRAHRFSERALARLREQFVVDVLALPIRVVEAAGTGDLMTRSTVDIASIGMALRSAVPEMFSAGVQMLFIFVAVFLLDPVLGVCSLAGLPLTWLVARWYLRRARPAYLAEGETSSDVSETLAATAAGGRTVEAFGLQQQRVADADAAVARAYQAKVRTLGLRTVLFPTTDMGHVVPTVLILVIGGLGYRNGWLALGAVVSAALYMWQLSGLVDTILMWVEQIQSSSASYARVVGVGLAATATVHTTSAMPTDDRLEARGVRYAYGAGPDVLRDVNLVVEPGERLAVVGPSGAGKTTLGMLLSGADSPRMGQVLLGGVPVAQLPSDELARRVVMVTQDHHVFEGTIEQNLRLATEDATDRQLNAALDAVGAIWVAQLPDGLSTVLGAGGVEVDAAQAQQIALARVILADPHTVILDEATSSLDPSTARRAERSAAALLAGRTVIAIAHRLQTAQDADRVAVVEAGRIIELGTHQQLVATDGVYAAMWRSWHGISDATPGMGTDATSANTVSG